MTAPNLDTNTNVALCLFEPWTDLAWYDRGQNFATGLEDRPFDLGMLSMRHRKTRPQLES